MNEFLQWSAIAVLGFFAAAFCHGFKLSAKTHNGILDITDAHSKSIDDHNQIIKALDHRLREVDTKATACREVSGY